LSEDILARVIAEAIRKYQAIDAKMVEIEPFISNSLQVQLAYEKGLEDAGRIAYHEWKRHRKACMAPRTLCTQIFSAINKHIIEFRKFSAKTLDE
jgi:hypothetical protein